MLSARPRSGRVKQLGLIAHPREGSRGTAPRKFMNFRPSRRLEIALSTLKKRDKLCLHWRKRLKEGKLNELGCKDGGNVIFWLVLKTYKWHYLEINVKEMKHFDDHSHMKKMWKLGKFLGGHAPSRLIRPCNVLFNVQSFVLSISFIFGLDIAGLTAVFIVPTGMK